MLFFEILFLYSDKIRLALYFSDKMNIHTEDIMKKVYKPERVQYYLDKYSYDIGLDEYENY